MADINRIKVIFVEKKETISNRLIKLEKIMQPLNKWYINTPQHTLDT